jgi:23S rRNA G2069 N7-methylase RlmK/C1962 C5-methylase RlmI
MHADQLRQWILNSWQLREESLRQSEALRVFQCLKLNEEWGGGGLAIEVFGPGAWVTQWQGGDEGGSASKQSLPSDKGGDALRLALHEVVRAVLEEKGIRYAVWLTRPKVGTPLDAEPFLGSPPQEGNWVSEGGLKFLIRYHRVKHPGLFLDHAELRRWLRTEASPHGRWLNAFAYTGSLSVAVSLGGAAEVVTNDLSQATLEWAQENFRANQLRPEQSQVWAGDTLDFLKRQKRKLQAGTQSAFDGIILDPPSFSRSKQGVFSVEKDLVSLNARAIECLRPEGLLVTSINTAQVSEVQFDRQLQEALHQAGRRARVLRRLSAPASFRPDEPSEGDVTPVRAIRDTKLRGLKAQEKKAHGPSLKGVVLQVD